MELKTVNIKSETKWRPMVTFNNRHYKWNNDSQIQEQPVSFEVIIGSLINRIFTFDAGGLAK